MVNCKFNYIEKEEISETEKTRLNEIHVQVFQEAVDSKAFRKFNNKLYTLKNNIQAGYNFVSNTNKKLGAKVVSIQTSQPGQHFLSVNVLPVSKELQGVLFANVEDSDEVNYQLKVVSLITKNIDKIKQWEKQVQNPPVFWEKLQKDLGIPKEQVTLLKATEGSNIEEKLVNFIANFSFTIEVNTAKENAKTFNKIQGYDAENVDINSLRIEESDWGGSYIIVDKNGKHLTPLEYTKEEAEEILAGIGNVNTQYYSNLTVPGGTNYTENEIATPAITPSIKGHAQFSTDKGIGWFRSDEQSTGDKLDRFKVVVNGLEQISKNTRKEAEAFIELHSKNWKTDKSEYSIVEDKFDIRPYGSKTRRILELQSDLFQKGRDKSNLTNKEASPEDWIIEEDFGFFNVVDGKTGQPINSFNNKEKAQEFLNQYKGDNKNQFLQLLNKDSNWVTFFVKSIIQDSARQTVTEVQESDVEAKVRELEKEGLLEIDCKGLKAEKGLVTSFTKGGKWKLIKDLKDYPTHKEGGVDLTIGKDGVKIKNGNSEFTAKHGLVIPKN